MRYACLLISLPLSFSLSLPLLILAHLNCQRRLRACSDCERSHLFPAQKSAITTQIFNDANAPSRCNWRCNCSNPISLILFTSADTWHPGCEKNYKLYSKNKYMHQLQNPKRFFANSSLQYLLIILISFELFFVNDILQKNIVIAVFYLISYFYRNRARAINKKRLREWKTILQI